MRVAFNNLEPESRIWIYQSFRGLTTNEQSTILMETGRFLEAWTAHGSSLQAAVEIFHDQFIVIGVNEAVSEASGCSIDKCVAFMQSLGEALDIDLLDRSKIPLKRAGNIEMVHFTEIKKLISDGDISADVRVFNQAVTIKSELEKNWELPISESWLGKYFVQNI